VHDDIIPVEEGEYEIIKILKQAESPVCIHHKPLSCTEALSSTCSNWLARN